MKKISFDISRLDRFAQGVYFGEKTTFVSRALPGEKGEATITRKAKGVEFAWPVEIHEKSPKRIEADCQHYQDCHGCHFRHVSHDDEINFKKESLEFELRKYLNGVEVETLMNKRVSYRNRIQLHYDRAQKKLGFINSRLNQVIQVPQCLIASELIKKELAKLYGNQTWLELTSSFKKRGHVELYERDGAVKLNWNQRYAADGFSQVNTELNNDLYKWIDNNIHQKIGNGLVLDLFGGGGNLSQSIDDSKRVVVDMYQDEVSKPFINGDLESIDPISLSDSCELMIVDPPRRGFNKMKNWVEVIRPEKILYISCDVSSLKRDLSQLEGYQVEKAMMIDFFGGTYHYESLVYLVKK